ncbi:hypothetical protein D2U88_07375 [Flagellimonas aequoris]|uniref:Uncharacterized protein n=1 Tax=Flagellimonas aequoris TaxID=2306997 RepID=A0A418N882_9FLAO|nr:hypothetical protein D2U88_07375 [Allomuricauda aequoris]
MNCYVRRWLGIIDFEIKGTLSYEILRIGCLGFYFRISILLQSKITYSINLLMINDIYDFLVADNQNI